MDSLRVCIGYDSRQRQAYQVCIASLRKHATKPIDIIALDQAPLREHGLYTRAQEERAGQLWDVISDAPMSTEFALTRFLVPYLSGYTGTTLFVDCDFLFRADVAELFALAHPRYAVQCIQHYFTQRTGMKMDHQIQTAYPRKLWSSLVLWNCGHPANKALTLDVVNGEKGSELHQFSWLSDDLIGKLPSDWGWFEQIPKAVHFTEGLPDVPGCESTPFSDEWREYL